MPDLTVSLLLARIITEHINFLGVAAWSHWQAVTICRKASCFRTRRFYWGVIRLDKPLYPLKPLFYSRQYFVTMQFSRWIRPGMRVYSVGDEHWGRFTCVAVDESAGRFVTVLTNQETFPIDRVVELPQGLCPENSSDSKPVVKRVYHTTQEDSHMLLESTTLTECPGSVTVAVEPLSVTTVILDLGSR